MSDDETKPDEYELTLRIRLRGQDYGKGIVAPTAKELIAWVPHLIREIEAFPVRQPAIAARRTIMHYRNGREAKNGDRIVKLSHDGGKIVAVGILHDAVAGNDYCNGNIAPIFDPTACMVDCLHADDLAAILAEKGLNKRPQGK